MLMKLGNIIFEAKDLVLKQRSMEHRYSFESFINAEGKKIKFPTSSPSLKEAVIKGTIYQTQSSGFSSIEPDTYLKVEESGLIENLIKMASRKKPIQLTTFSVTGAKSLGKWIIESISTDESYFVECGSPLKIGYKIKLSGWSDHGHS